MKRNTKAFWIGFFVPVVPAWGIVLYSFAAPVDPASPGGQALVTFLTVMYFGGPSVLLGGVIGAIAFACTKLKDPLKCVGCGYSLVGLGSGKCPLKAS